MKRKELKILAFIISLFVFLSNVNSTYSRYVSGASGTFDGNISRWRVLVNNEDITRNYSSSLEFSPEIDSNVNVESGKIAPGSTGHFDIYIDCSEVTTSYQYIIQITYANTNELDNLKVTGYSIVPVVNGQPNLNNITTTAINNSNTITETKTYNNTPFQPYMVRLYFEWISTDPNNANDTRVGKKAANGDSISFSMTASLTFTQTT